MSNTNNRYLNGQQFENLSILDQSNCADGGYLEVQNAIYVNNILEYDLGVGVSIEQSIFQAGTVIIPSTQPASSCSATGASLTVYGGILAQADSVIQGILRICNNNNSLNLSSGSLIVNGGAAISQNLNVGGTEIIYSTTPSTSTNGSLITYGGITILNTTDATNYSSGGGLTVLGGASISETLLANILQAINVNSSFGNITNATINNLYSPYFISDNSTINNFTGLNNTLGNVVIFNEYVNGSTINNLNNNFGTFGNVVILNESVTNSTITNLNVYQNYTTILDASTGNISNLTVTNLYVTNAMEYSDIILNLSTANIMSEYATLGSVIINNGTFGSLSGTNIYITNTTTENIYSSTANIYTANINNFYSTTANITNVYSSTANITNVYSSTANITNIYSSTANITNIYSSVSYSTTSNIINLNGTNANLIVLNSTTANIYELNSTNANFSNITVGNIDITGTIYQNGNIYESSQWIGTSGSIYYPGYFVGIGTSTPTFSLEVIGQVQFQDTIPSYNSTTGSVIIIGGLSIECTVNSTSYTSGGGLTINGGLAISKDVYIGGVLNVGGNVINNCTAPSLDLQVANKWYVDQRFANLTVGNVSGNFIQYEVIVATTGGNITGYANFLYDGTLLQLNSTVNSLGLGSGGSINILGGISVLQDFYLGGVLDVNGNVVNNCTAPSLDLQVANKWYVDQRFDNLTVGNVSGSFTEYEVIVATTGGNITGYSNFLYNGIALSILDTIDATSLSSGGVLNIYGGATIDLSLYIGGNAYILGVLDMNNQKITSLATCTNPYDAANKYYVDMRISAANTINGNFTTSEVLVAGSSYGTIVGYSDFTFDGSLLSISSTTNSIGLGSGGSLDIFGGVSILQDTYIGGVLDVNQNVINNCTAPSLDLQVANKWYVDNRLATVGSINGNFSQGQVIIGGTAGTIVGYSDFTFSGGTLFINSTNVAIGLGSGGSLDISGGLSVLGNVFLGGTLDMGTNGILNVPLPINPLDAVNKEYVDFFLGINTGDIQDTTITLGNNVITPLNIPGFLFNNTQVSSFDALAVLKIPELGIYQQDQIRGLLHGSFWEINTTFIGDNSTGIIFSVNSIGNQGQIQYTNTNSSGTATLTFRAETTSQGMFTNFTSARAINTVPGGGTGQDYFTNGCILFGNGTYPILTDLDLMFTQGALNLNGNVINNVTAPNLDLQVANKWYVDQKTTSVGSINGNFTQGQVIVAGTAGTILGFTDFIFDGSLLSITSTTNTIGLGSGGSLNVNGGVSILQDVYIGGILDLNQNVINNCTAPSLDLQVANKWYVDNKTVGSVNGNFTQGQIIVGDIDGNIVGYPEFTFTSGSLLLNGILNVLDNPIINVPLPINPLDAVNKEYIDYYLGINTGDIQETAFTLGNGIFSFTDISNFLFSNTQVSSFDSFVYLQIPEINVYDQFEIKGLNQNGNWVLNSEFIGSMYSGISFNITNTGSFGQMQYINSNTSGTAVIRFRALTTGNGIYNNITLGNILSNVPHGGTGQTFFTNGCILFGDGGNPISTDLNLMFTAGALNLNGNVINNVTAPNLDLQVANKWYVDQKIAGTGIVTITSTNNATSPSSGGALTDAGGAGFAKDVYIGQNLIVSGVNMTPNSSDIFQQQSFSANNNQIINADITNFVFDSSVRYFQAMCSVTITGLASNKIAGYELKGINLGTSWQLNTTSIGQNTGITFNITNYGQVQYISNYTFEWVNTTIKFRALTLSS